MKLLDNLYEGFTYSILPSERSEESDLYEALSAFKNVPLDYLILRLLYGSLCFENPGRGVEFTLRDPVESHELYFEFLQPYADDPEMFPMTESGGGFTMHYGTVNGVEGVYVCKDNAYSPYRAKYVAPSLKDIIRNGVGLDVIASM